MRALSTAPALPAKVCVNSCRARASPLSAGVSSLPPPQAASSALQSARHASEGERAASAGESRSESVLQRQLQRQRGPRPSIDRVRRTPVRGLALAVLLALVLAPTAAGSPSSARAAASELTVRGELARLLAAGAIDQPTHDADRAIYVDALVLRRKLKGARRAALGAVLRNVEDIAAAGALRAVQAAGAVRDARAQPPVVGRSPAAAQWRARELRRQPPRVAVLRRRGPGDPVARDVRKGQRPLAGRLRRVAARAARRDAGAHDAARGRHRVGVPVPLRRRPPAMGQRPRPGRQPSRRSRARRCGSASRATSRPRAPRWASSASRPRAACASRHRPAPITSSIRSRPGCACSTRSPSRSTGCTTSARSPTTPRVARCSPPARRSCARELAQYDTGAWSRYAASAGATPTSATTRSRAISWATCARG